MGQDGTQLFSWRPEGHRWVELVAGVYRPARISAEFTGADGLWITIEARGDEDGVKIVRMSHRRFATTDDVEVALAKKDYQGYLDALTVPLGPEDAMAFDPAAAAEVLAVATLVHYHFDGEGRPEAIAIGGGPFLPVTDLRRWLAGPKGPPPPGPKAKANLDQVAKLWRAAVRKKVPAARAVADGLDVSISTAHRYINAARKAGLIDQEA